VLDRRHHDDAVVALDRATVALLPDPQRADRARRHHHPGVARDLGEHQGVELVAIVGQGPGQEPEVVGVADAERHRPRPHEGAGARVVLELDLAAARHLDHDPQVAGGIAQRQSIETQWVGGRDGPAMVADPLITPVSLPRVVSRTRTPDAQHTVTEATILTPSQGTLRLFTEVSPFETNAKESGYLISAT
jgi:hypothetical protein